MEAAKVTIEAHQLEALKMDLHRTFPDHALFESDAFGQQELERVLKAVVCHLPEVGYCQGMSFVAAVLLMFMEAEEAFYTLIVLIEKHLSRYYSPGSYDLIFDSKVLWNLVKYRCPLMTAHIEREVSLFLFHFCPCPVLHLTSSIPAPRCSCVCNALVH
jgi:hypothetical protein